MMRTTALAAALAVLASPAAAITVHPVSLALLAANMALRFSVLPRGSADGLFSFTESQNEFAATFTGESIDADEGVTFGWLGDYWLLTMSITENAGTFWDVLSVNGIAQHTNYPDHGHGASIPPWRYRLFADADAWDDANPGVNSFSYTDSGEIDHPGGPHVDRMSALLSGTIDFDEDITGYTVVLTGQHPDLGVPSQIPVPAGLVLSATALTLLIGASAVRRRKPG